MLTTSRHTLVSPRLQGQQGMQNLTIPMHVLTDSRISAFTSSTASISGPFMSIIMGAASREIIMPSEKQVVCTVRPHCAASTTYCAACLRAVLCTSFCKTQAISRAFHVHTIMKSYRRHLFLDRVTVIYPMTSRYSAKSDRAGISLKPYFNLNFKP